MLYSTSTSVPSVSTSVFSVSTSLACTPIYDAGFNFQEVSPVPEFAFGNGISRNLGHYSIGNLYIDCTLLNTNLISARGLLTKNTQRPVYQSETSPLSEPRCYYSHGPMMDEAQESLYLQNNISMFFSFWSISFFWWTYTPGNMRWTLNHRD